MFYIFIFMHILPKTKFLINSKYLDFILRDCQNNLETNFNFCFFKDWSLKCENLHLPAVYNYSIVKRCENNKIQKVAQIGWVNVG